MRHPATEYVADFFRAERLTARMAPP
jgi:hypothetical protein